MSAGAPVHDVDPAPIRIPAREATGEVVVGIGDPAVVLLLELVDHGARVGIPAAPELLDEILLLLGTRQFSKTVRSSWAMM